MEKLFAFCEALDEHRVRYGLQVVREGAVMVSLVIPGEYLEIEFFVDGSVEVERFISQGVVGAVDGDLDRVIATFSA